MQTILISDSSVAKNGFGDDASLVLDAFHTCCAQRLSQYMNDKSSGSGSGQEDGQLIKVGCLIAHPMLCAKILPIEIARIPMQSTCIARPWKLVNDFNFLWKKLKFKPLGLVILKVKLNKWGVIWKSRFFSIFPKGAHPRNSKNILVKTAI